MEGRSGKVRRLIRPLNVDRHEGTWLRASRAIC